MNKHLIFSIRVLWVLTLLASLGILFAALPGYFTEQAVADPVAEVSTLTFDFEESVKLNTLRAQITYGALMLLCFFALGIEAYRYRTLYTPVERQQTKWVAYGTALWMAFGILSGFLYLYLVNLPASAPLPWWSSFADASWYLFLNILPIAFTLAIMRSHLWDIDVIIRRTLVYTVLTATVGLMYLGSVVLLQQLAVPLIGGSEVAIVASTLAIAALFNPLRQRIQNLMTGLLSPQVRRRQSAGRLRRNRPRRNRS
jgi:hypothetical protein